MVRLDLEGIKASTFVGPLLRIELTHLAISILGLGCSLLVLVGRSEHRLLVCHVCRWSTTLRTLLGLERRCTLVSSLAHGAFLMVHGELAFKGDVVEPVPEVLPIHIVLTHVSVVLLVLFICV